MIQSRKLTTIVILLLSAAAGVAQAELFDSDQEVREFWSASDESSTATVDHSGWQSMLDRYLVTDTADGIYRFRYAAVTAGDQQALAAYLQSLSAVDPRVYNRAEQLAYWINFYNALTVEVVLEHYPVKSIRQIYGGVFNTGPWDEALTEVAGQALSLNDIEHGILRPVWQDPRIHYAVNCASLGCPNLAPQVYSAANVDAMLAAGAQAFINHPRAVEFDSGRLKLSSIFDWYAADFGADQANILEHLAKYATPQLAAKLIEYDNRISYDYDWQLNEP